MGTHKKNVKSSYSTPGIHIQKLSQDMRAFEFLSPKTASGPRRALRLPSSFSTPREDSKISLYSTIGLIKENKLTRLPKDLKSLDTHSIINSEKIPPDRNDAKKLLIWLDKMLEKTLNELDDPEEIFEKAYKVYNVCLAEVVSQVSLQCKERGIVIDRVWKAYLKMFEKATRVNVMKIKIIEETHVNEKNRIHKIYDNQVKDLEKTLEELLEKCGKLEKTLEEKNKLCEDYAAREENTKKRLEMVQYRYRTSKKEVLLLKEEVRVIKIRLQNQVDNVKTNNLSRLFQKVKIKSAETIEKELNSDPVLADISLIIANDQAQLLEQIKNYGKPYVEQSQNIRFSQDDYKDAGTDAPNIITHEIAAETLIEDLCGESIGVKRRKAKRKVTLMKTIQTGPLIKKTSYHRSTSLVFNQLIDPSSNIIEHKKKHIRMRNLLKIIKEVRV